MNGTYSTHVGDHGEVVLPIVLQESAGLHTGTQLTMIETSHGIILLTRDQLRGLARRYLSGLNLVGELLEDRQRAATENSV